MQGKKYYVVKCAAVGEKRSVSSTAGALKGRFCVIHQFKYALCLKLSLLAKKKKERGRVRGRHHTARSVPLVRVSFSLPGFSLVQLLLKDI